MTKPASFKIFTGSAPSGHRSEVWRDPEGRHSVYMHMHSREDDTWLERHELSYSHAMDIALEWLHAD